MPRQNVVRAPWPHVARTGIDRNPVLQSLFQTLDSSPVAYRNNIDINSPCQETHPPCMLISTYLPRGQMEKKMTRNNVLSIAAKSIVVALMLGTCGAWAQDAKTSYPSRAPLDQYLMKDRNAEIALARSAAPESISC